MSAIGRGQPELIDSPGASRDDWPTVTVRLHRSGRWTFLAVVGVVPRPRDSSGIR